MKILLKNVKVIDNRSPFHNKKTNILINDGVIVDMGDTNFRADETIDHPNLHVSIGWMDMRADFCDPGYEQREDLNTGVETAAAGGFTAVALLPNTNPVIQTKNEVSYLKKRNHRSLVDIYPMAAVTLEARGEELTEMIDLHEAGAVAFTDGLNPIWHTDILKTALLYLKRFDGLLINRPEDTLLTRHGSMNESVNSTILGLTGMPKMSEEIMVERDLKILEYTGGKIHFSNISTKNAVRLIKRAKKRGMNVTCDVAVHNLILDDSSLMDFDTHYKVNPPLREPDDIRALVKGLYEGTIDTIVSSHTPQDSENKECEFDAAEFGMISLQTTYPLVSHMSKDLNLIEKFTFAPREILNLPIPKLEPGQPADLTLFDPKHKWVFTAEENCSKSENSPFLGMEFTGKALGVFKNGGYRLDEELSKSIEHRA